ncbi:hypothetical protein ABXS69_08005 [Actinomyces timonensis]|uniref:Uncharacterized protein n=1 Tax=Actinomyces timonensis TaxID=1288391 RepID=A0AAU8N2A6_9ACTO
MSASTPPTMAAPWLSTGQGGRTSPTIAMAGGAPAADGAQRATPMSSAGTAPTTAVMPGGAGAAASPGPGSPSLPAAAHSPAGPAADGAALPRERRRKAALGGLAVLLVLSLAAGGAWWWIHGGTGAEDRSAMGWTSGITAGSSADSQREFKDADDGLRLSPEGSVMLAKVKGAGKLQQVRPLRPGLLLPGGRLDRGVRQRGRVLDRAPGDLPEERLERIRPRVPRR